MFVHVLDHKGKTVFEEDLTADPVAFGLAPRPATGLDELNPNENKRRRVRRRRWRPMRPGQRVSRELSRCSFAWNHDARRCRPPRFLRRFARRCCHPSGIEPYVLSDRCPARRGWAISEASCFGAAVASSEGEATGPRKAVWCRSKERDAVAMNHPGAAKRSATRLGRGCINELQCVDGKDADGFATFF